MPVQDPLFETSNGGGNPAGSGGAASANQGGEGSGGSPQGLTAAAVEQMLDSRMKPITESVKGMNDFFGQLRQRADEQERQARVDAARQNSTRSDFSQAWIEDPQGALADELRRQTEPVVSLTADAVGELVLSQEQDKITDEFGPKAWDEVIKKDLDPVLSVVKSSNPQQLLNKEAVRNAIRTIVGHEKNRGALNALREEWSKDRSKRDETQVEQLTERVLSRSNLSGGIRRAPASGSEKLSPDQQEILNAFERDMGTRPDETRVARLMNVGGEAGTTLDQWKAATQAGGSR